MFHYVKENIKKNLRRYIFTFLIFIVSIMFINLLAQLVYNMGLVLDKKLLSDSHKTDIKNMMETMNIFKYVIIGFCYIMIENTYKIILQGRLKEFKLLYNLGISIKNIKKMLYGEMAVISTLSLAFALPVGVYLSILFMKKYDAGDGKISLLALGLIAVFIILSSLLIINNAFKVVIPSILENENKINNITYLEKKKKLIYMTMFGLGIVLIILSYVNIGDFRYEFDVKKIGTVAITSSFIKEGLSVCGILLSFNFGIYLLILGANTLAKTLKLNSLYLAMEQKLYNFKSTNTIITTCVIAIVTIVTTFGMFHSSRKSAEGYVDKTIAYDSIVICEQGINKSEAEIESFRKGLNSKNNIVPALIFSVKNEKNYTRILTGIDKRFFEIEKVEPLNKSKDDIFKGKEFNAIVANDDIKKGNKKIGDEVKFDVAGKTLSVKITDSQKTINRQQIIVDKNKLSKAMFGTEGINNALYLKGVSEGDRDNLIKFLGTDKYSITNISDIKETYRKNLIQGTEVIEAFLYILLVYTVFLILNMFLLSFEERIKQYATLRVIGVGKLTLIISMLLESVMIFVFGALVGLPLGFSGMKEGAKYVEKLIELPIQVYTPVKQFTAIIGGATFVVFLITLIIGVFITKKNYSDYLYRE